MGFIWKMFGTIVENRFSRASTQIKPFLEFGKIRGLEFIWENLE